MSVCRYRKKPVEVEAMRFDPDGDLRDLLDWLRVHGADAHYAPSSRAIRIETLEGSMRTNPGDYIIRGVKDEFYPCKPDIFEATYEAVGE